MTDLPSKPQQSAATKALPPNAGKGRRKGVPNKTTRLLKEAILQAAEEAGGREGMIGYLRRQAIENPGPFLALLGKVLPHTIAGPDGGEIRIAHRAVILPEKRVAEITVRAIEHSREERGG